MASLLELLQKNKEPAPQANPLQDLALTLQAKTGKAAGAPAGPVPTGMAQRAAQAGTASQLGQVEQAKGVEMASLQQQQAAQQAQAQAQGAALDQRRVEQKDELSRQTTALVNSLEREKRSISGAKKRDQIEQAGFLLGLQNDQYLQNLEQTAGLRRWNDKLAFEKDLQGSLYADNIDLYRNEQEFQTLMAMDDAEFQKHLQGLELNDAFAAAKRAAKAQARRQVAGGVAKIGSAVAGSYFGGAGGGQAEAPSAGSTQGMQTSQGNMGGAPSGSMIA